MALTITLEQTAYSPDGVNFNEYWTEYFADFTLEGFPYMLGSGGASGSFEGDQMVFLDNPDGAATKSLVLNGSDFQYYFNEHTMSGTLNSVLLARLGDSYNSSDGSFTTENDHIANITTPVKIDGLTISNPYRQPGDFHEVIAALMGGGPSGGGADVAPLEAFIWAEGHNVIGSEGNDVYTGTDFDDTVRGNGGDDMLDGGAGTDTAIFSGKRADYTLDETAAGAITVSGGADGTDTLLNFEFATFSDGTLDLSDFSFVEDNPTPDYEVQKGGPKDDVLIGSSAPDKLIGGKGDDRLDGKGGNDILEGNKGNDTLNGGNGQDKLIGGQGADTLNGGRGADVLKGGKGADTLNGGNGPDKLVGGKGADKLNGGAGSDVLQGGKGDDTLNGGKGQDVLKGGAGADTFVFKATSHSKTDAPDTIVDFTRKQGDKIDLSAIDAQSGVKGNQAFDFIGKDDFSGTKGELRFDKQDGDVFVYGDVNGDGEADFAIVLDGGPSLKAGDFVL